MHLLIPNNSESCARFFREQSEKALMRSMELEHRVADLENELRWALYKVAESKNEALTVAMLLRWAKHNVHKTQTV